MRVSNGAVAQLITYSDELRDKGEPDRADEMLAEAALARPLDAPDLLATLRATLRASRADRVTALLCRAPIDPRAAVAGALLDTRVEPDATILLDSICGADGDVVHAFALFDHQNLHDVWWPAGEHPGSSPVDALSARLLDLPNERCGRILERLFREGIAGTGHRVAGYLASRQPERAVELAVEFVVGGREHIGKSLIDHAVDGLPPDAVAGIIRRLSADTGLPRAVDELFCTALVHRPDPHAVFQSLRLAGAGTLAERFLGLIAAEAPATTVAALVNGLLAAGEQTAVEFAAARAATRADRPELCDGLHRLAQHKLAYLIAERG